MGDLGKKLLPKALKVAQSPINRQIWSHWFLLLQSDPNPNLPISTHLGLLKTSLKVFSSNQDERHTESAEMNRRKESQIKTAKASINDLHFIYFVRQCSKYHCGAGLIFALRPTYLHAKYYRLSCLVESKTGGDQLWVKCLLGTKRSYICPKTV